MGEQVNTHTRWLEERKLLGYDDSGHPRDRQTAVRWEPTDHPQEMAPDPDGDWMDADDAMLELRKRDAEIAELRATVETLRATVERVRELCRECEAAASGCCGPDWGEQARIKAKQLRKVLAAPTPGEGATE